MTVRPAYLPCGDSGLTIEFGRTISPEINAAVLELDRRLAAAAIPGVIEAVPTYRSLFVQYDPLQLGHDELVAALDGMVGTGPAAAAEGTHWRVPVAYGGAHGEDLAAVAERTGLAPDEVVAMHAGAVYRVYMIGFIPGFTYLGGLPDALHLSRRTDPRLSVPAGSVAIGGIQTGICPMVMPSGWHLLGRTPLTLFRLDRDPPVLFATGDRISFVPIDPAEYDRLAADPDLRPEAIP